MRRRDLEGTVREQRTNCIGQQVAQRREAVLQNLADADCSEELVEQFMRNAEEGRERQAMQLLKKHRCELLERVHQEERRIDRLDYLLYSLGK